MRRITFTLLFLSLFSFYLYHAAPSITCGDSAELAAVGATLGIAHSPGYPLYSLLGRVICSGVPWASPAYRMTVFSTLCASLAIILLSATITNSTGSLTAGLLVGLWIGLSPLWIHQALSAEVFALNSLLCAAVLFLAEHWLLASYLLALGLGNQHTLVLLAPALALLLWFKREELDRKALAAIALCIVAGFSCYLFIPLRAQRMPLMNWEEPATLHRFWQLVTRARYGSLQISQGAFNSLSPDDLWQGLRYTGTVLRESMGIGSVLVLFGALLWLRQRRTETLIWILAFIFAGPVFFALTRLAPTPYTRTILDRFVPMMLIPAGLLAGAALAAALEVVSQPLIQPVLIGAACLAIGGSVVRGNVPTNRENFILWDVGRALLRSTPPNAYLLADRADEAEFSLAYLQRVASLRQDVTFIDCNAGVSRSMYGPDYYEIWGRPRLALRTAYEKELIAGTQRPVYYATHEPDMIPIHRIQQGLLWAATPVNAPPRKISWEQFVALRPGAMYLPDFYSRDREILIDTWQLLAKNYEHL